MAAPAKFSLALGSKKTAPPNAKKRPHSTLHDSDDEDASAPQAQEVSHFDVSAGGAIDASKPKADKGPLVIPKQGNRDWRAESQARKRQKSQLPSRPQANGHGDADDFEEEKPVFGLNIVNKAGTEDANPEAEATNGAEESAAPAEPAAPKTEDQLALEALLGEGKSSGLVVPIAENEEEAFHRDYQLAPDVATLEEYEAVPVEEFGAAMLRGMGWKEGEAIGRRKGQKAVQPRVVERRPALLGIGAKPDAAIAEELGAWGKGGKGRGKPAQSYNPVVMRNTKTGEQLTEEELKQKLADQEAEALARERERAKKKNSPARDSDRRIEKSTRHIKYDEDDYESDRRDRDRRRREKDSDRDYDSKRRSSRRDRDRSASDEDRHRRRKYDSKDYDRRDKDRERDRDRDRDRKYRDKERNEYYSKSSSRHEHRDRSRDRYRDSDRDRRRHRDD
ncbi:hypothetical protein MPH_09456 [Macrophomina phaseolina MS6]|uniref:Pre-mRNA-splicing factor n=1 Tax=Macrophomina phaseolina (strain MS6) TaxID=1126212 RepID=K2S981_MACPH|nr:hypothetical protein MPH_09456 [Macrophomina phaseolina MS6]